MTDCLRQMLSSADLSDVQFTVGRQFGLLNNFPAHKLLLAARSSVFRAMFFGGLPEKCHTALDIPDIHPEAFANLLSFIYTDSVRNLNADNVFATLSCADKYDVPQLVQICSDMVTNQLNLENCLAVLEEAIPWHAEEIVHKCLDFVDAKSFRILQSEQFTTISHHVLQMILQRSTLTVEENFVYMAAERWATAACARNNMEPSGANQRHMLGDAVFLIRFPLLTPSQLADGPGKSDLLNEAEISSIVMYQHATVKPPLPFPVERRTGPPPLDPLTLRYGEDVFVKTGNWDRWEPARVTGFTPLQVFVVCCSGSHCFPVAPEQVVRGADILHQGQALQVRIRSGRRYRSISATYDSLVGCRHQVSADGQNTVAWFHDLQLLDSQVASWKAINGKM
ncbi:BTB/POZ domain-containing protein 6-B-like [Paramacrobiotus metropolitanus]|uniref:BTB/POZ domain-containing protein 6-B-like n=1 Tax=Paramacrobiotus metropolitanus TaxID=2943436 RepID=UPI002445B39A|nr:BTB/POZ domain-containing protein 6-B-like [Paramacrobiotus metropolitanus]